MGGFQVVPVLDVRGGRAVHAVGGDRAGYRPVRSILAVGDAPRELAGGLRAKLGISTLYLADLDAIAGADPDAALYRDLARDGEVWVDAGLRTVDDLVPLSAIDGLRIIVGLETVDGPEVIAAMRDVAAADRLIVSLDLRHGRPIMSRPEAWGEADAAGVGSRLADLGVRTLILLDLARVGRGRGVGTTDLMDRLLREHPSLAVVVGGGVAGAADLAELRRRGAAAVLVGSAFHDGRIGPETLADLRR